jgi:glycine betaine/proline transport system substrate-binding protein
MARHAKIAGALLVSTVLAGPALAQDACSSLTFSDVGWTDITATTAATTLVLEALGYETRTNILSVPVTFQSIADGDTDIFLGNWMPAQEGAIRPYLDEGTIEEVATNLEGTQYTLAVPKYTYDKGLTTFEDIAEFRDELDGRIYGIEPGNEGNGYIISLIENDTFGLSGFEVVESSEQAMLAQVGRAVNSEDDVVFLGWAPHPMNSNIEMEYLTGGEEWFGDVGTVHTVTRTGLAEECPNIGTFLSNLKFTLEMENEIMGAILDDGEDARAAAQEWLTANPDTLDSWLDGVTTVDGEEGLAAVRAELGL